jgi:hypothetical protein
MERVNSDVAPWRVSLNINAVYIVLAMAGIDLAGTETNR